MDPLGNTHHHPGNDSRVRENKSRRVQISTDVVIQGTNSIVNILLLDRNRRFSMDLDTDISLSPVSTVGIQEPSLVRKFRE
jgi:hypothetical protein